MAVFVNQHQFFIDKSQLVLEEVAEDSETYAYRSQNSFLGELELTIFTAGIG